jgi:formylglycine-generating enzyme required for sulfatase activity
MAQKVFINYRRSEDWGAAQALYQQLESELPGADLFMDVEGKLRPGDNFVAALTAEVAACDVLLAIVGPRWAELLAARATGPKDFVVIEIEAALDLGKRVIPVLVGGAAMPHADSLPDPIRALAERHAVSLRPDRFRADCQGLLTALKQHFAPAERAARTEAERHGAEVELERTAEAVAHEAVPSPRSLLHIAAAVGLVAPVVIGFGAYKWVEAMGTFNPATPLGVAEERALKPGDIFKECGACPEMVVVPAGSFIMGSPPEENGRESNEGPQHPVTIPRPFGVGRFEVTFAEWDACVTERGCRHRPKDGWGRGKHPVTDVSWGDIANQYLPWLSRKTGKLYRMLTEAEWEYVARAGTTTPFWWGVSISAEQANYDGGTTYVNAPKGEFRAQTVPVDTLAPNPWGLYNVHGNVWEWVQDCWSDSYDGGRPDGAAWTAESCDLRVLRGGSWYAYPWFLRSAARSGVTAADRSDLFGLRVARTF